jgi:hypothetical protein
MVACPASKRTIHKNHPQESSWSNRLIKTQIMSSSDDDEELLTGSVELAASVGGVKPKTARNRLPRVTNGDDVYPFLERPCTRDLTIFNCLLDSQPFATPKNKGLTAAWINAVKEINDQIHPTTGEKVFVPPIAVSTVRDRFNDAMKVIAKLHNQVAFNSGCDDEAAPNELRVMLEDLHAQKKDWESKAADAKLGTMAKKMMDRDAGKSIQRAAVGKYDDLTTDSEEEESPESGATKKRRSTLSDGTGSIKEMMEQRKIERDKNAAIRMEQQAKQLAEQVKTREQAERHFEIHRQLADKQMEQADRAMEFQRQMCIMMKGMNEKMNEKKK